MLVVCYYYGLFILRMHSNCDLIRSKVKIKMYLLLRASISSEPKYCLFFHDIIFFQLNLILVKSKCALNVQCYLIIIIILRFLIYLHYSVLKIT